MVNYTQHKISKRGPVMNGKDFFNYTIIIVYRPNITELGLSYYTFNKIHIIYFKD